MIHGPWLDLELGCKLPTLTHSTQVMDLCFIGLDIYMGAGDLNLGLHACTAGSQADAFLLWHPVIPHPVLGCVGFFVLLLSNITILVHKHRWLGSVPELLM